MNLSIPEIHSLFQYASPYITFGLGIMGAAITWRNFSLTTGHKILSSFCITSGVNTDSYVSQLILENRKNKPEVINGIYLQLGHHYVIELKEYERDLLILRPMEAIQIDFERVSFYAVSDTVVDVAKALSDRKIKKHILISTTRGIVKAKSNKEMTFLMGKIFKNSLFGYIKPYQYETDGMLCSDDIKFIVKIDSSKGAEKLLIGKEGRIWHGFLGHDFVSKRDALESKDNLEKWFNEQIESSDKAKGTALKDIIEVKRPEFFKPETCTLPFHSWVTYVVIGKVLSIYQDLQLKIENYKIRKARREQVSQ